MMSRVEIDPVILLSADSSAALTAALLARLLIVRMLFELAQKAAGLHLLIEALQRGIDRLIRLDGYVDHSWLQFVLWHNVVRTGNIESVPRPGLSLEACMFESVAS